MCSPDGFDEACERAERDWRAPEDAGGRWADQSAKRPLTPFPFFISLLHALKQIIFRLTIKIYTFSRNQVKS